MNVIVTGSLGHIGEPLTRELVQEGHTVTVISSNPERQTAIESLGAAAAIGAGGAAAKMAAGEGPATHGLLRGRPTSQSF